MSFLLPKGPLLGLGEGGPQFDRKGSDRSHAQRPGRLPAAHARRARADSVAGRHRRLGPVHPPAARARSTSPAPKGSSRRASAGAAARCLRRRVARSRSASCASTRASPGLPELPRAVDVRLHAVAPHARRARRDPVGRADVSREEAAVRRADLSRHRVHAVGLEHAQRRVRLAHGELSRSEEA